MKTTIYAKDDYAEKITVEYTPAEWIVERDALRRFVLDYGNCAKDRKIAIRMLEGDTVVTEITRMIDKNDYKGSEMMKLKRSKQCLKKISLWSFVEADEYHALKTAMFAIDALGEIEKELREEAGQHDFPNDFAVALAIVKKHITKIEEK